jgi:hypothetical protein
VIVILATLPEMTKLIVVVSLTPSPLGEKGFGLTDTLVMVKAAWTFNTPATIKYNVKLKISNNFLFFIFLIHRFTRTHFLRKEKVWRKYNSFLFLLIKLFFPPYQRGRRGLSFFLKEKEKFGRITPKHQKKAGLALCYFKTLFILESCKNLFSL